jgi:hypothetical protein
MYVCVHACMCIHKKAESFENFSRIFFLSWQSNSSPYCHSHNNWRPLSWFQRLSSSKLVLKTVESWQRTSIIMRLAVRLCSGTSTSMRMDEGPSSSSETAWTHLMDATRAVLAVSSDYGCSLCLTAPFCVNVYQYCQVTSSPKQERRFSPWEKDLHEESPHQRWKELIPFRLFSPRALSEIRARNYYSYACRGNYCMCIMHALWRCPDWSTRKRPFPGTQKWNVIESHSDVLVTELWGHALA